MSFCRHCGKELPAAAINCGACGGSQASFMVPASVPDGPLWPAITSLVLGIAGLIACLDDGDQAWDRSTWIGLASFMVASLVFGIFSLYTQTTGRGLAIAGVILSSLSLIFLVGMLL